MTMLSVHREALESAGVCYHEFLLRYREAAREVYGIVEGKDDPMFYHGPISTLLPADWSVALIRGGSKQKVLQAHGLFNWDNHSPDRVCFFVDRDLSVFLPQERGQLPENVYVTDDYSIESDAISADTLRRVLAEVMNIGDLTPDEELLILSKFDEALAAFLDVVVPLMAQIILWRRAGQRPCLDNIRPGDIAVLRDCTLVLRPGYSDRDSHLAYAADKVGLKRSSNDEINAVMGEISSHPRRRVARGKYLMWFLVAFVIDVHESLTGLLPSRNKAPRVRVSLGVNNGMVVIAPRVRCPSSLRAFIERTFLRYIKSVSL